MESYWLLNTTLPSVKISASPSGSARSKPSTNDINASSMKRAPRAARIFLSGKKWRFNHEKWRFYHEKTKKNGGLTMKKHGVSRGRDVFDIEWTTEKSPRIGVIKTWQRKDSIVPFLHLIMG